MLLAAMSHCLISTVENKRKYFSTVFRLNIKCFLCFGGFGIGLTDNLYMIVINSTNSFSFINTETIVCFPSRLVVCFVSCQQYAWICLKLSRTIFYIQNKINDNCMNGLGWKIQNDRLYNQFVR